MKTMYKKLKDVLVKPIIYSGLAALTLSGCHAGSRDNEVAKEPIYGQDKTKGSDYFDHFGYVSGTYIPSGRYNNVALGDVDGDGDVDIILSTYNGITIFENKIPQKKP